MAKKSDDIQEEQITRARLAMEQIAQAKSLLTAMDADIAARLAKRDALRAAVGGESNVDVAFDSAAPRSLAQAIVHAMKKEPSRSFKAGEICEMFKKEDPQTIRSTLSRLAKSAHSPIKHSGHGLYTFSP